MDNEVLVYILGTLNALLSLAITVILRIVKARFGIETSDIIFKPQEVKDVKKNNNS